MDAPHGVAYPSGLLNSLPKAAPSVHLLPTKDFEDLHLSHILAHPQDHVLFPFLHGLEGENEAQNSFFASAPNAHETHMYTQSQHRRVRVPKYRGLVCVVCEEDLVSEGDVVSLRILRRRNGQVATSAVSSPSSSMYSSSSESYEEDDDEYLELEEKCFKASHSNFCVGVAGADDHGMRLSQENSIPMPVLHEQIKDNGQNHMHPVSHRSIHSPAPITVPSSVSSSDTSASSATSFSFDGPTTPLSVPPELDMASISSCSPSPGPTLDGRVPIPDAKTEVAPMVVSPSQNVADPAAPPLLTGTFRPKELIRRVKTQNGDWDWEFSPVKVPDGISLRNFGIQVPIYATLADIIVYSPKGASAAAISLAGRFARAIELKRQERLRSLGLTLLRDEEDVHGLLKYNVFVLDASEEDMRRDLPHLMMRVCVEPISGGLFGNRSGAHIAGFGGEVLESTTQKPLDRESGDGLVGVDDMDVDYPRALEKLSEPNTVDFAQREKEEMRDLTKASEIISLFPVTLVESPPSSPNNEDGSPQPRHRSYSSASSHHPYRSTRPSHLQFLPQVQPPTPPQQNYSFSPPIGASFDFSSTLSYYDPHVGQIFLGNSGDVPIAPEVQHPGNVEDDPFDYESTNDPKKGLGYDICIECHDLAAFPSAAHLRAAEEHLCMVDVMWAERYEQQIQGRVDKGEDVDEGDIPPRPPPHANAVIHLTLPSSPSNTQATMSSLMPVIRFLEKWLRPVTPPPCIVNRPPPPPAVPPTSQSGNSSARRWSSVSSFIPSFPSFTSSSSSSKSPPANVTVPARNRSFTSPSPGPIPSTMKPKPRPRPTRPLKVLIYSSDGYTESSMPALCLLMAIKGLTLPEAYLELQVNKRRSFFVYNNDLGFLRRVEARLKEERERSGCPHSPNFGLGRGWSGNGSLRGVGGSGNRPAAKSVSFATSPSLSGPSKCSAIVASSQSHGNLFTQQHQTQVQQYALEEDVGFTSTSEDPSGRVAFPSENESQNETNGPSVTRSRPRAKTSPWLSNSFSGNHQTWFDDPRFDGSFPSRVLPFLYLGNLNHATNAYMLHALGITHVVSVGECALVPPLNSTAAPSAGGGGYMTPGTTGRPAPNAQFIAGKGPGMQGSLWIEEREGRIKVLDIKGVCDDGIDTLEPQLEPICEWIDKAREEGGQVLVHCRVGVSRSATVVIAYVMKHLNLPLVDAYLIVRSRRLSVLIQPNMRLLYNLCGWEIQLAKQRARGDKQQLQQGLSRALSWPYLAKEVHALNEKYLH